MGLYRFATPVWTLTILAGALAVAALWDAERRPRPRALLAAGLALGFVLSLTGQHPKNQDWLDEPALSLCKVTHRFGGVFNGCAQRLAIHGRSVLLPDLGGTLLTSRLKVVDLAGLTDPVVADAYAAHDPTPYAPTSSTGPGPPSSTATMDG
ncbi:hypothetical protein G6045_08860 [Streptomyces sp. YC504]|uniref:Uncharacterized protein n=1 Tax=Streptomyces mesophilus TaxID=1775132 RepID=A0A6G4XF29_9ACTN|nr:hypothetical protein [Streptomyces mesophilus]NGO75782.1 hypothetical protein [Streptomyces mesophilus]